MPYPFKVVREKDQTTSHPRHWAAIDGSHTLCGKEVGHVLSGLPFKSADDCTICAEKMEERRNANCSHSGEIIGSFCGLCWANVARLVPEPKPYLTWPEHMKEEAARARYIR